MSISEYTDSTINMSGCRDRILDVFVTKSDTDPRDRSIEYDKDDKFIGTFLSVDFKNDADKTEASIVDYATP